MVEVLWKNWQLTTSASIKSDSLIESVVSAVHLKGNSGVKTTLFQILGLYLYFQFSITDFTDCLSLSRYFVLKTSKNVIRVPPSWKLIACSEKGQRING